MTLSFPSYTGFNIRNKQASKSLKMISAIYPSCSGTVQSMWPFSLWTHLYLIPSLTQQSRSADTIKGVLLGKQKIPRMPLPNKQLLTQCCLFFTIPVKILLAEIYRWAETTRHTYRTVKTYFLWKLLPAGQTDCLKCMSPDIVTPEATWPSLCTAGPTHFSSTVHSSLDALLTVHLANTAHSPP